MKNETNPASPSPFVVGTGRPLSHPLDPHIDPSATIAPDVTIGFGSVILGNVVIGAGSTVGHHVVIHADTVIGRNVRIDDHAVLGKLPMRAANSTLKLTGDLPPATLGDNVIVGSQSIIYRGAAIGPRSCATSG